MSSVGHIDLVLIHPGNRSDIYQSLGTELSAIQPPIWAGMLATFVRRQGYSVFILDAEAENLNPQQVGEWIGYLKPLLAGVVVYGNQPSASTQNMTAAGEICTSIKHFGKGAKSILIGGHVTALPERTLSEEDVDFIAVGEGPYTISDLLEALKTGEEDFTKVRGLCYREACEVKRTSPAPLVINLAEEIPELAWDLLPMEKYKAHNWHAFGGIPRQPYAAIYTTLGCPYRCTFCCIQAPFKSFGSDSNLQNTANSYRFWDPESVITQIDSLVGKYDVRNLRIADEMFVLNRRHVEAIADLIIQRKYDLNIWAYARVDSIPDQSMLEKLAMAGFKWLCIGIESANQSVLDDVDKSYKKSDLFSVIHQVRNAGINILGNYIFGLPKDDISSMQQTLNLAIELNCEFANFYSAMAYPGSELYNLALEKSWELPEKWSGYSQHSVDTLPLPTEYLSGNDVLNFRDQAWQRYFTGRAYLDMIEKRFGLSTREEVQNMASHKLDRINI